MAPTVMVTEPIEVETRSYPPRFLFLSRGPYSEPELRKILGDRYDREVDDGAIVEMCDV